MLGDDLCVHVRVRPRVIVGAVAGVITAVGAVLLPDSLQPTDGGTLAFAGFGVGALATVPRLWPGMILGAGAGYVFYLDEPLSERFIGAVVLAMIVAGVDLWLDLGPRVWSALARGARLNLKSFPDIRRLGARAGRSLVEAVRITFSRTDNGTEATPADARQLLQEVEILLALLTAILYGASWLAAEWFYGSFGVSPEEVGLTTLDLLLGAGVATVLIASIVIVVDTLWRKVRHPVLRVPAFVVLGITFGGLFGGWPGVLVWGGIGLAVGIGTSERDPVPRPRSSRWVLIVTGVVVGTLGILAFGFADEFRIRLDRDEPSTPTLLNIQIATLWAPTVRVWPVEGQNLPAELPPGACAHRFGSAGGVTVFLHRGKVFRLPTQSVLSATARCPS